MSAPLLPAVRPARTPSTPAGRSGRGGAWTAGAAAIVVLLLVPFVPLVLTSVSSGYFHPQVVPDQLSTRAWSVVLTPGSRAWSALVDTMVIGVAVTVLSLLVAVPAGRVLGTRRFRGRRVVELLLLLPVVVPTIAVAIGIHVVFIRLGLAGGLPGVVLVHLIPATPYVVLLSAGVFANLDPELEAQARSLGAPPWRAFTQITLPLVAPGLAVAGLLGFLVSWGQYALTLVIGGGRVVTLPILLFASAAGGDDAITAATALFHGLPAVVVLIVAARLLTPDHAAVPTLAGAR